MRKASRMTADEHQDDLRGTVQALHARVAQLEEDALVRKIRSTSAIAAGLLIAALWVPLWREDDTTYRLLTLPVQVFEIYGTEDSAAIPIAAGVGVFGIGVTVLAASLCLVTLGPSVGRHTPLWLARTCAVLMWIGVWGPLVLSAGGAEGQGADELGYAGLVYFAGVIAYSVSVLTEPYRSYRFGASPAQPHTYG